MSILGPRLAGPGADTHPALQSRRVHDLTVAGLGGLVSLGLAMGIAVAVPNPNVALVGAIIVGTVALWALLISPRYPVTLTIVAIYLGLLDGPVKLLTASQAASAVRNVLVLAVAIGMLVRLAVSKQEVKMPPLAQWVLAFVAVVIVQAFNPETHGILKVIGGFRQELEWIPFFFFAYLIMRSKLRFRQLFLIIGVLALANGLVGAYQSRLSPAQLGSWGPGYSARVEGAAGVSKRTFAFEGESKPRPPGLGPDSGFSGGIGAMAVPGLLALLSVGRLRRRWIALVLCAGALLGVAAAASRSSLIIGVIALLSYAGFSVIARLKVHRLLIGVLVSLGLAYGVASLFLSYSGPNSLHRQETVGSSLEGNGGGRAGKERNLFQLPRDIAGAPLGAGLGTGGSAGGFGGKQKVQIEGKGVSREGALNLLAIETGAPGLLLWIGLTLNVVALAVLRLRFIADPELRTYLVAVFAAFMAFTAEGFAGPTLAGTPAGVYLWFAIGIASYWLAGPGYRQSRIKRAAVGR
jgi:hypothetical protein